MKLRDEQGMMAIGVALMLIVVLTLFGGVLWQYSMMELRRAEKAEQDMQALFLARAGAEAVMGAWQQEINASERPFGELDTLYFDLDTAAFVLHRPANPLGQIDVVVKEEAASDEGDYYTVIEATAQVGSSTRTARLVTYPHLYGHHPSLQWYEQGSGQIGFYEYVTPQEPVIMRTRAEETPIHFGPRRMNDLIWLGRRSFTFSASDIIFESPLRLIRSENDLYNSPSGHFSLVLEAQKIFLHGLELSYLSSRDVLGFDFFPEKYHSIVLRVPDMDDLAERGDSIADKIERGAAIPHARYGQVYFSDQPVVYSNYEWYRRGIISWKVRKLNTISLKLAGKAFYFQDGFRIDPKEIRSIGVDEFLRRAEENGMLLPIKSEFQVNREQLKGLRPFYWEQ